jgi:hypothetical protein
MHVAWDVPLSKTMRVYGPRESLAATDHEGSELALPPLPGGSGKEASFARQSASGPELAISTAGETEGVGLQPAKAGDALPSMVTADTTPAVAAAPTSVPAVTPTPTRWARGW